jgi:putative acyl-CoA dehydrogenase
VTFCPFRGRGLYARGMATHEVLNQPPPLENYDPYQSDPLLRQAVEREGGGWGHRIIADFGRRAVSSEVMGWGFHANVNTPHLVTHDRFGRRSDTVEYHPAYHALMDLSVGHGLVSLPFERRPGQGGRVVRDAMFSLISQVEAGHGCPVSMTTSVVPALRTQPDLAAVWEPAILQRTYDPRFLPAVQKRGLLLGMGMTEKQGGSDVRANTTSAVAVDGGADGEYRLTGHKWFTSAPMCDAFLVLAQAPGGLTCFLLPRFLPDGTVNAIRLQRLKDKLGNRSNASSEIELEQAYARVVGEEGRGVATIIEMVNHTRLDCVVGSVGLMRQAVSQAAWHASKRSAFGTRLIDKPLMRNVLADLEVEVEAATLMMMRLSGAFDRADTDPDEAAFRRLATPIAKYWVTKRCSPVTREAMECLGGNGYVEESIMPRLFRESPVNAIWEGSGNVIALDVIRAMSREPHATAAFLAELDLAQGADRGVDAAIAELHRTLAGMSDPESQARSIVERMAVVWAASLMVRHADEAASDAYVASRVLGEGGAMFGTLPVGTETAVLAGAAIPAPAV